MAKQQKSTPAQLRGEAFFEKSGPKLPERGAPIGRPKGSGQDDSEAVAFMALLFESGVTEKEAVRQAAVGFRAIRSRQRANACTGSQGNISRRRPRLLKSWHARR